MPNEKGDGMTNDTGKRPRRPLFCWKHWFAIGVSVSVVLMIVSCSTVHRAVVNVPMVPGAEYLGSKECEQCHEKIYRDFMASADHARLMTPGPNAKNVGCESCHGPRSWHL